MAEFAEIEVGEGSRGLVTNRSAIDSERNSFRELKGFRLTKPGLLEAMLTAGTAQLRIGTALTDIPALPSGFTLEQAHVYHKSDPSDSDVIVIFGSKGGRDRFYVWPNIVAGAWVTNGGSRIADVSINWLELTEAEQVTVNVVTSTTVYTLTGLENGSTADYYNGWFLWNNTRTRWDYVTDSNGAEGVTAKIGIVGVANGDTVILMRFQLFIGSATVIPYYQIDNLPTFAQHGDDLTIHTGAHALENGFDLWLGFIGNGSASQGYFDDNDLDFNGWHCDQVQPFKINDNTAMTLNTGGAADNPFPYSGSGTDAYGVNLTGVYDGVQEGRVRVAAEELSNDADLGAGLTGFIANATSDLDVTISLYVIPPSSSFLPWLARYSEYSPRDPGDDEYFSFVFSRRIRKFRLYIATAELISGVSYRTTSQYFFIKEIDIDDAGWSGPASGAYSIVKTLTGSEYKASQAYPFEAVNGFNTQLLGANARFGVEVGGRAVVFPIYDDTRKLYRGLFTPIRLSGETSSNVLPAEFRIDVRQYGITEIKAGVEQFGRLLIFGLNTLVVAQVSGENRGEIIEQFQKIGTVSYRTVKNIDGMVYFASTENPLEAFDGNRVVFPAPGFDIKDVWDGMTQTQKEAVFAGYHKKTKTYVLRLVDVSSNQRIFLYDTRFGNWTEYPTSNTYVSFVEGVNNELFGFTGSSIVELFSENPTEALVPSLETQVFDGTDQHVKRVRLHYKSTVTIKAIPIDDSLPSTLREKIPVLFLAEPDFDERDRLTSFRTNRAALRLEIASATNPTIQIEALGFAVTPKREE